MLVVLALSCPPLTLSAASSCHSVASWESSLLMQRQIVGSSSAFVAHGEWRRLAVRWPGNCTISCIRVEGMVGER